MFSYLARILSCKVYKGVNSMRRCLSLNTLIAIGQTVDFSLSVDNKFMHWDIFDVVVVTEVKAYIILRTFSSLTAFFFTSLSLPHWQRKFQPIFVSTILWLVLRMRTWFFSRSQILARVGYERYSNALSILVWLMPEVWSIDTYCWIGCHKPRWSHLIRLSVSIHYDFAVQVSGR